MGKREKVSEMVSKAKPGGTVPTILVIDDDLSLLAHLGTVLEEAGYEVLKMSAVAPAEIALAENHPDLVLLEVRLGEGAGWQLLKQFASHLSIMVLSVQGREDDVVQGLDYGAVDYLAKPYRTAELLARIKLRLNSHNTNHYEDYAVQKGHENDHEGLVAAVEQPAAESVAVSTSVSSSEEATATATSDTAPPHAAPAVEEAQPDHPEQRNGNTNEVPSFMVENEEIALLRSHTAADSVTSPDDTDNLPEDMSLGRRLYMARRRQRITLVQAENEIKISMAYLQAMEEEKFSMLPRGTLAAQMLRSYATFLGVDVQRAMQEYDEFYSTQTIEPVFGRGAKISLRGALPGWLIRVSAVVLALVLSGGALFFFDPEGINTLSENVRSIVIETTRTPIPTASPELSPTVNPSPTSTPSPTPAPTLTPSPIRSPVRSHPYTPMIFQPEEHARR
jgi:DNA-binding response OmpR family regulator